MVSHTVGTLNTFVRVTQLGRNIWFLPYQIGSYAWFQMVALSFFVAGQDLVPADPADVALSFENALICGHVTAISSTPTFWRVAFMSVPSGVLANAPIRSISLGGEIVDQAILDQLTSMYPGAKIRHIYASTEAGAAIVVSDGRAGFDAKLLDQSERAVGVRVEEGRLLIRSPYGHAGASEEWIDTGDLVDQRDGRVYFMGRATDTMINVGGQKAFPADIEAYLMSHQDVTWARVTARRAPLVGSLPAASIVLRRVMDAETAEGMLIAYCENRLAEYAIPRIWEFLKTVPIGASLKS